MPIENSAFLPYFLTACMALGYLGPRRYNVFSDNMKSGACERAEHNPCFLRSEPHAPHEACLLHGLRAVSATSLRLQWRNGCTFCG